MGGSVCLSEKSLCAKDSAVVVKEQGRRLLVPKRGSVCSCEDSLCAKDSAVVVKVGGGTRSCVDCMCTGQCCRC